MKINSNLVWIATLALPLAVGCGGGSKEEAPSFDAGNTAATTATTAPAAPAGAPA